MNYLAVILGYLLLLIVVGLVVSRKSVKNADDFAAAGRRLPMIVLIGTLLATWCGGGGITGSASIVYIYGPFAGLLHFLGAPVGMILLYWIAGKVRQTTTYTIPELFGRKYGQTARVLASVCIILAYVGVVSSQFSAAGNIIALATGINRDLAIILCGLGIVLLTVTGGLVTVAYTDALSAFLMVGGFLFAAVFLIAGLKLPGGLAASLPEGKNTLTGSLSLVGMLGYMLPSFFLILGDQNMMQRFGAARDATEAKKSTVGLVIGEAAVVITTIMICTAGIFLIPKLDNPAMVIFEVALHHLPFVFGAVIMAACVAFVVTTGDSFLLSATTNFTYDIWAQFIKKDATDRQKLVCMRFTVVVLAVVAYVMGRFFPTILAIQMYSYTMYGAAITPALLCALFYKKVTAPAGLAGIIFGAVLTIVWAGFLKNPGGLQSAIISVPASFVVIFLVSACTQGRPQKA